MKWVKNIIEKSMALPIIFHYYKGFKDSGINGFSVFQG